jgi:hypothetical protein
MMSRVLRVFSILIGVGLLLNALRFAFAPESVAAELGMELLTGVGASTQIGDIGALFLAAFLMIALGQRSGHSQLMLAAAILLGSAAFMRTVAAVMGNADFAPQFILPEVVMTVVLIAAARDRSAE